jgi:hypothetical protein
MPSGVITARGRTDDRGRYRLFATPGTFYIVATDERSVDGPTAADSRVYYPGTATLAGARPVRSEWGRDATGFDIELAARASGRIEGFALDAAGHPLTAPVMLRERHWSRIPTPAARTASVGAAGEFSFSNVPPGDYVVQGVVRQGRAAELGVIGVTIADDETRSVIVRTSPGTTMSGSIVLEGEHPDVEPGMFTLSAEPPLDDFINPGPEVRGLVRQDGTFEWAGLHGQLRIVGDAPAGWWLKSVNIGAFDAASQPYSFGGASRLENVVAVFTDTAGEIAGRVVDRSQTLLSYTVLVFAPSRDRWSAGSGYVKVARPDPAGRFRALALPPGDYLAVAIDRFDLDTEWLDPDLLAELAPSARRVTVRDRQQVTIELDLIRRLP